MLDRSMAPDKQLTLPFAAQRGEASVGAPGERPPVDDERLMERVVERANLFAALARVKANAGSPGVDGMTVEQLPGYLRKHWPTHRTHWSYPDFVDRLSLGTPGSRGAAPGRGRGAEGPRGVRGSAPPPLSPTNRLLDVFWLCCSFLAGMLMPVPASGFWRVAELGPDR